LSSPSEERTGISVVTTTWNERENITKLILRIKQTLQGTPHEIIVVDDNSADGTIDVATQLADTAISKIREGQTKGFLSGTKLAKYPIVITIDSDLENPPELIPFLIERLTIFDVVVAARDIIPRFSERLASKTIGKRIGISDFFSNYRAYKRETIGEGTLRGETFGGELLINAKKLGYKLGEIKYKAPPRRKKPRIGGSIKANFRIILATCKCWVIYFF
jgi:dolichol-phosphate mannosyltransferase